MKEQTVLDRLLDMRDEPYRAFTASLVPNIPPECVLGVRLPALRQLAKEMKHAGEQEAFLRELPHRYHEENLLHAFLVSLEKDYAAALRETEAFLPYVDNWAVCDSFNPKVFAKHTDELLPVVEAWLQSGREYTVRFGLETLMRFYLDDGFRDEILALAASVNDDAYYVHMMVAWLFATALAKQYDAALPYLEQHRLSPRTHNKTIQKAIESYRVTEEHKVYLKTLRLKKEG